MKFFENVLKEETLIIVNSELNNNMKKAVWNSSRLVWQNTLTSNNSGAVLTKPVSEACKNKVVEDVKTFVPNTEKIFINMHIWDLGSGIALHDDASYKFASTLYLNSNWHPNYGGWFIWKDEKEKWNAFLPEHNNLVLNDTKQYHTVTPISPTSPELRLTLQIFGE
tara:strand:+ start:52 stop:549 length:498 start_codon:yes stop_codon:yes gene_type:complete